MLAVKSVMADQEKVETLIFDEIDSGISGRTAQMVSKAGTDRRKPSGDLYHASGTDRSDGRCAFMIEKKVIENETQTSIRQLDEKESIDELARILGGAKDPRRWCLTSAKEMRPAGKNARGHGFQNEPE